MSEIANKTILELTPLNEYQESDAIPVQRPNLNQDNCIALSNIIWYDKNTKQLIINGRYRFDMSSLIQANLSIKLLGDSGITNFIYNGQTYLKNSSIESSEDQLTATITANVDSHYTFNKWQFNGTDISTFHTPDYPYVLNYTFTTGGELSASTTPRQYTITVNTATPSQGTVSGGGSYNYGQSCTITATANSGFKFVRWTKNGSQVSTNPSYNFTVTENATYTAVFEVEGPPDYYVGWATGNNSSFDAFSSLDGNALKQLATGYFKSNTLSVTKNVTSNMVIGNRQIFFIMWRNTVQPIGGSMTSGGITDSISASDFSDNNVFNATHNSVTIDNETYSVAGMRGSFDIGDSFTIDFQ